jgi:HEAT repeat protein
MLVDCAFSAILGGALPPTASLDEVLARSTQSDAAATERGYDTDQYEALERLGEWPEVSTKDNERIVAALTTALGADNGNIRNVGARGLGRRGHADSIATIMDLGRDDANLIGCFFSGYTLGRDIDPPVESLRQGLVLENSNARREVLRAIADCRATSLRVEVEAILGSNAPPAVRDEAATTLCRLKLRESAPALRKAFDGGLQTGGVSYGLTQLGDDHDIAAVLPLLKSKSEYLRRTVAAGLFTAQLDNPMPAREALLDALGDSSQDVRISAVKALGRFQESRALPAIRELVLHPHPRQPLRWEEKRYYIEAIVAIGGGEAVRLLDEMLPQFRKQFGLERAMIGFGSPSSARAIWTAYLADPLRPGRDCLFTVGYQNALPVLATCADADLLGEIEARLAVTHDVYHEEPALRKLVADIRTRLGLPVAVSSDGTENH